MIRFEFNISTVSLSPAVCDRSSEDPDLADFYEAVVGDDEKIICVTACDSLSKRYKKCFNKGVCQVFKQTGPLCK